MEKLSIWEKNKEEIEYFERYDETKAFGNVIQPAKWECPACFCKRTPKEKIYHCQPGHFFCEEHFGRIWEKPQKCPFCIVDIASNSIRCRLSVWTSDYERSKLTSWKLFATTVSFLFFLWICVMIFYSFSNFVLRYFPSRPKRSGNKINWL